MEHEPEFENHVSTTVFIKQLVEKMNRKAENDLMGPGIFGKRSTSVMAGGSYVPSVMNPGDYNQYNTQSREPSKFTTK